MKLYFCFDGETISDELIHKFSLSQSGRDLVFSMKERAWKTVFVGIIMNLNQEILTVMPKHYSRTVSGLNINDTKLLFETLQLNKRKVVSKYKGNRAGYESDFPLNAFFKILSYYEKYGLYKEEENLYSSTGGGKINWKKTIQKSPSIISENNVVILPLIRKRVSSYDNILTFIMAYALEIGSSMLTFLGVPKISLDIKYDRDLKNHKNYYISQLKKYLNRVHKDIIKDLVINLIIFLDEVDSGSSFAIKHFSFASIWEEMVFSYLNNNLVSVSNNTLNFQINSKKYQFNSHRVFIVDTLKKWKIIPDYYWADNQIQMIFDAKYYSHINELNYKQIVYQVFLSALRGNEIQTLNILFLPSTGINHLKNHTNIDPDYLPNNERIIVYEQYLNVNQVMVDYLRVNG